VESDEETIEAVGKLTEALEWVERARGRLYDFHQMMGHADSLFAEAASALAASHCDEEAEMLQSEIVGRNVLDGRWTFQVVEEFDDTYYDCVRELERKIRNGLTGGRRHVYEDRLKERRRTRGNPFHSSRPS
jgi:hypothetical protein